MSSDPLTRADVDLLLKAQQSAFEGFLRSFMDSVNTRIDNVLTQVVEVKASLTTVSDRVNTLCAKDEELVTSLSAIENRITEIDKQTDYLENQSRRNNLRIDGVLEDTHETWEATESKVKTTLITSLGFSQEEATNIKVERAHRTGKNLPIDPSRAPGGSPSYSARSIVVKLNSFKDRELILKRARQRRPRGLFVNEDFSQRVIGIRKELLPELKQHRDAGRIAYLSYDKLIVKDRPLSDQQSQHSNSHQQS